jgi:uncharacterized protein (TIGR03067 family)
VRESELWLWDTGPWTGEKLSGSGAVATAFAFAPDSSMLAIRGQGPTFGTVTLYNVKTESWVAYQRIENRPPGFGRVDSLAFTRDGQKVVWSTNSMTTQSWDKDSIQGEWKGTKIVLPPTDPGSNPWGKAAKAERDRIYKEAKAAMDRLEGTWTMTEGTTDGKPAPPVFIGKIKLIFAVDKCVMVMPDKERDCTYKVGGKSDPGQIEITGPNKVMHGIYEIKDDTLKLCLIDTDRPRPTEFKSEAGSRVSYLVLKKQAAGDR